MKPLLFDDRWGTVRFLGDTWVIYSYARRTDKQMNKMVGMRFSIVSPDKKRDMFEVVGWKRTPVRLNLTLKRIERPKPVRTYWGVPF